MAPKRRPKNRRTAQPLGDKNYIGRRFPTPERHQAASPTRRTAFICHNALTVRARPGGKRENRIGCSQMPRHSHRQHRPPIRHPFLPGEMADQAPQNRQASHARRSSRTSKRQMSMGAFAAVHRRSNRPRLARANCNAWLLERHHCPQTLGPDHFRFEAEIGICAPMLRRGIARTASLHHQKLSAVDLQCNTRWQLKKVVFPVQIPVPKDGGAGLCVPQENGIPRFTSANEAGGRVVAGKACCDERTLCGVGISKEETMCQEPKECEFKAAEGGTKPESPPCGAMAERCRV